MKLTHCSQECQSWEIKKPTSTAAMTYKPIRFDHTNLFPGSVPGVRFNSSIIESDNSTYIYAFRNGWSGSNIYLCRLNDYFEPFGEAVKLELGRKGCTVGREDPRLFRLNGRLHCAFTGYTGRQTNVCFARIDESNLTVEDRFLPTGPGIHGWQKNWSMFDYHGVIHAVYETSPSHRILRIEGNRAEFVYSTPFTGSWSGGYMRGGASPILHAGAWYHFFHGAYDINGRRRYCMGLTVFRATPPFDIIRYSPDPLEEADLERKHDCYADVIFPGGAVYKNGRWIVSHGIHDRWSEIRFYDAVSIESCLVPA